MTSSSSNSSDKNRLFSTSQATTESKEEKTKVDSGLWDKAFAKIPKEEMYRYYIDQDRQAGGEDVFDKEEPGYKKGMLSAFELARETMGQKINADFVKKIHAACLNGVTLSKDEESNEYGKNLEIVANPRGYGFKFSKCSDEAKKYWSEKKIFLFDTMYSDNAAAEALKKDVKVI